MAILHNYIIVFTMLSIINVIFSTVRTILTVKGNKLIAALSSGGYFAFYTVMLIYTVADFPLAGKVIITFICNVIGVWLVKWIEERKQKERLWKIEITVPLAEVSELNKSEIPHSYIVIDARHALFNFYCATKKESRELAKIIKNKGGKFFAAEGKDLF